MKCIAQLKLRGRMGEIYKDPYIFWDISNNTEVMIDKLINLGKSIDLELIAVFKFTPYGANLSSWLDHI